MILHQIPDRFTNEEIPHYEDHHLFSHKIEKPYSNPIHMTGLGLISMIEGKVNFTINDLPITLDQNSFLIINRGSRLSFEVKSSDCTPFFLYFNSTLSNLLTTSALFDKKSLGQNISEEQLQDYALVEHVHYKNASLREFITLLLDLAKGCASFHALKADMLIRHLLDNLIDENYEAISISTQIPVVKQTTRIALYRSLSISKSWIDRNFKEEVDIQQMADVALLNREHYIRLFKKAFQVTPRQYLIGLRIQHAKKLLIETNHSISSICHEIGFQSLSSFSGLFKQRTSYSPQVYRQKFTPK